MRSIIDGQQRLTSVTLLLRAVYEIESDPEIREEISEYLYNKGVGVDTDFMRVKLHLNEWDDKVYRVLLASNLAELDDKLNPKEKKTRVYLNYRLFCKLVSEYLEKGGASGAILQALESLTLVKLEVQQENPQEIFESLNSTGLDLTNVDLLRNYFLMRFPYDKQSRLYKNYWSKMEEAVGESNMEAFFSDYLVFRRKSDAYHTNGRRAHINENSLYPVFREFFEDYCAEHPNDDYAVTEKLFADMTACAASYKNFIFSDDVNFEKLSALRKKLYFLLVVNEAVKSRSLLLYLFDLRRRELIDDAALNDALDAVTSLVFRARVCGTRGVNRQFSGSVMQRLETSKDHDSFMDSFWKAITSGKGSYAFPSDAEFLDALEHKELYQDLRSKGTKYLLYTLEAKSPYAKGLASFESETLSTSCRKN